MLVADSYITVTPKFEYISQDDKTISEQQQYWKFTNNFFVSHGGRMSDSHNTLPDMVPVWHLSNVLLDMQSWTTKPNLWFHPVCPHKESHRGQKDERMRRVKELKCQLYPTFKMHWLSLNLTLGTLLVPKGTLW